MNLSDDPLEPASGNDSGFTPERSLGVSDAADSGLSIFHPDESKQDDSDSVAFTSLDEQSLDGQSLDEASSLDGKSTDSMEEYYQLKQELLVITIAISIFVFGCVWFFYSLATALNYLLGACTSVVYLRLLARNVEQLGAEKRRLGRSQLAIFVGLIIVATQWNQLKVLPIFLGFLTYKATLLIVMLRSVFVGNST